MNNKKVFAYSLSKEAAAKIDRVADIVDKNRSLTLERIIMSLTENSMVRHARRRPTYDKGDVVNGNSGDNSGKDINT